MPRPKGTNDPDVTRRLVWLVDLLRQAQEAGVEMKLREAAEFVVQAADGDSDMLRAVSRGRRGLPMEAWDAIDNAVGAEVTRRADRRAADKIRRKRATVSPTAHKRAARDRRAAGRASVEAALSRKHGSDVSRRSLRAAVRALEQAYRDRGHEITLVSVDDLFPSPPAVPYFPA